ncbi:MAG: sensor histidine kinase [Candidatus Dormibacteraeota bacterium]|uniref:histidine kinase n=1 Tax=Candidatus Aeolococcus gillhamiae TaxID=3127015 RepID=A0A934JQH7_9BACT|nr:sensor histidine kinase [Candidatus Dormibacteraeota bacterium]
MGTTSTRAPLRRVSALAVATLVLGIASVAVPAGDEAIGNGYAGSAPALVAALFTAAALAVAGLGCFVALRRPHNPIGWLLAVGGASYLLDDLMLRYAGFARLHALPGGNLTLAIEQDFWIASIGLTVIFVGLLFPSGKLLSRRWRWVARVAGAGMLLAYVSNTLVADPAAYNAPGAVNPLRPAGLALDIVSGLSASFFLFPLSAIAAVVALVLRYRRGSNEERHQIRMVMYAAAVYAATIGSDIAMFLVTGHGLTWLEDMSLLGIFGIPAGAGVAVLKHRLYDIDVVISRTLVYGSLAVFITAVYVGIAVGIGALIGGGGKPNLGLSIVATAIVAVGFQPVRERVQRVANRLVYGRRATPYEVLSQFSERVAESYATHDVMPRMARVLAEGTGAQRADVWLRSEAAWRNAAAWPVDTEPAATLLATNGNLPPINGTGRVVEVRHQGDLLGALSVTKRAGESLTPVEANLLTHLAGQAGLVLKNVGLTDDLQARLEELRASRQRLVTAQDEERRRLERNLHDGAQQHLVALKVKLGLVEMLASRDPEKAKATITQLKADADEALETLRDLARGIYPPLLADKGLVVALESQARKATVLVTVEAEGVERYPQDIEAAVYFCCLEAIQNVQKYAQASSAVISLHGDGERLRISVTDDGSGFDMATRKRGAGITNMADRLDALGGAVELQSAPGQGTTLRGWLPVALGTPPGADAVLAVPG